MAERARAQDRANEAFNVPRPLAVYPAAELFYFWIHQYTSGSPKAASMPKGLMRVKSIGRSAFTRCFRLHCLAVKSRVQQCAGYMVTRLTAAESLRLVTSSIFFAGSYSGKRMRAVRILMASAITSLALDLLGIAVSRSRWERKQIC